MSVRKSAAAGGLALLLAGCGGNGSPGPAVSTAAVPAKLAVTSSAFGAGGTIPVRYTCKGDGTAPPVAWAGADPSKPLALVVDDPDAPGGTFVHWVVVDLPAGTASLPAGGALPAGAHQATNSGGSPGWTPPCPPSGTHHYQFSVYVLSRATGVADGADKADAIAAIQRLATARGQLVGLVASG
jgi:Raf kinase inhibitor-like YbhB/YbcL family protein